MNKPTGKALVAKFYHWLSAGYSLETSLNSFRKALGLNLLLVLGSCFLLLLGTLALFQQRFILGLADYAALCTLLGIWAWVNRSRLVDRAAAAGIWFLGPFYFFLFVLGGVEGTAFVWYYTFPVAAVFLQGVRRGTMFAIALLLAGVFAWFGHRQMGVDLPYSANLMLRLVPSYLTVLLFAVVSERIRQVTHARMESSGDQLSETIAQLEQAQRVLREQAIRDGLTGLHNRRFFDEFIENVLQQAQRHGSQFSVLMVDVDHFKAYNDTLGHPQGDEALRQVGAVLRASVRRRADMVFRYGGEEFVALLTDTIDEASLRIAASMLEGIRAKAIPHPEAPAGIVTVSIGVAHWTPGCSLDTQPVIDRADHALYRAKHGGRDRVEVEGEASLSSEGDG